MKTTTTMNRLAIIIAATTVSACASSQGASDADSVSSFGPSNADELGVQRSAAIRERNLVCPRRMVTRGLCRVAWYRANPEKAELILAKR